MIPGIEYRFAETNGVKLHVACAGPKNGPPVILLHGFPEFWYGWRHQIPALASAGYRVIVPDQRGYNLSDKPRRVGSYGIDQLSLDVIGLMDWIESPQALIVGHDWGAAVAWHLAMTFPERVDRLVALNVPHPAVMIRHLRGSFSQTRKSWYIFLFQLPWLPETMARIGNWRLFMNAIQSSSHPGAFSDSDLQHYRQAWSRPGAFRSMIHWYRAALRTKSTLAANLRIAVPTLLIWGAQDRFLDREMAQPSIDLCDTGQLVFFEEATHWVQHEEADRVNELIINFLSRP